MAIYLDADACPVKAEALKVAERHGWKLYMVSNSWMRLPESPILERVLVEGGFDAADDWIAERAQAGDIVVTGDVPLASRCLKSGAKVLGHGGRPFTEDSIGMAVAMRDLKSHLRDRGEIRDHGPSFSKQDRSRFLSALEEAIQTIRRGK